MSIPAPKAGRVGASWLRRGWAKRIGRIVLVLAAIVGVPVLVVWFTGGQSSVIYWIDVAMFSLFAYTIGFWPLWVVLVVPLGLVTWVVGKFRPWPRADRALFHAGHLDTGWHQRVPGDGPDPRRGGGPTHGSA